MVWGISELRFGLLAKCCAGSRIPDLRGRLGGEFRAESQCCLIVSINRSVLRKGARGKLSEENAGLGYSLAHRWLCVGYLLALFCVFWMGICFVYVCYLLASFYFVPTFLYMKQLL